MAENSTRDAYRTGVPRIYGLGVGVFFFALAIVEIMAGRRGLKVGGHTILVFAPISNSIHWATGVAALGATLAGEVAVKIAIRVIGVILAALAILGLAIQHSTGLFALAATMILLYLGFAAARPYYVPD